jgi:hypothetical protein
MEKPYGQRKFSNMIKFRSFEVHQNNIPLKLVFWMEKRSRKLKKSTNKFVDKSIEVFEQISLSDEIKKATIRPNAETREKGSKKFAISSGKSFSI